MYEKDFFKLQNLQPCVICSIIFRQYFEKTNIYNAFAGYHEASLAIIVRKAATEVQMEKFDEIPQNPQEDSDIDKACLSIIFLS